MRGALLCTVMVAGLGAASFLALQGGAPAVAVPEPSSGVSLAFPIEAIALPDVTVIGTDGRSRSFREQTADNLLVVTFNYTTCTTICPVGTQVMKSIDERVGELARPVRLMSITIDPANDTPSKMREAAEAIGASQRWLWLTGRPAEIDQLLARFGARAIDVILHDPIFLIGDARTGRFTRITGLPHPDHVVGALKAFAR